MWPLMAGPVPLRDSLRIALQSKAEAARPIKAYSQNLWSVTSAHVTGQRKFRADPGSRGGEIHPVSQWKEPQSHVAKG